MVSDFEIDGIVADSKRQYYELKEIVAGYLWNLGFAAEEIDSILEDKSSEELRQMKNGYEKGRKKLEFYQKPIKEV